MSLALGDLPRDHEWLLLQLQHMTEVVAAERSRSAALEIERDTVLAERDAAQAEIEKLRLLIRQLQRGRFGRRSERLDPDQLQLGLEDLEQTAAAAEAAQEEAAARNGTPRPPRVRRRNLGALPAHLPRVEVLVDLENKSCPCCGGALHVIGEDREEMHDIVPAPLRVKVIRRPRYGCRSCEEAVVQAPAPGRTKTGRLWGYAVDDRPWQGSTPPAVVYLYAEDRKGEHPAAHLAEFQGMLQVDGYGGFKRLLENRPPGEIRLAFCWAHCRRGFYEIHQSTGSPLAAEALRRIGELYKVEAEIRGRPAEERRTVRQERSKPIVDALHAWLTVQLARVSGKSGLAEAIRYALRHWQGLVLFLEDGRLELGRVEDGRGGVSLPVGYGGGFLPPPPSRLAGVRFSSPPLGTDVQNF